MPTFNDLMREITDRQRALMGLPPLKDPTNQPVQRGSPLWERLTDHTPDSDIDISVRRKEGVAL